MLPAGPKSETGGACKEGREACQPTSKCEPFNDKVEVWYLQKDRHCAGVVQSITRNTRVNRFLGYWWKGSSNETLKAIDVSKIFGGIRTTLTLDFLCNNKINRVGEFGGAAAGKS